MGPIAGSLHTDSKKIMGNGGKTGMGKGNIQGHSTRC